MKRIASFIFGIIISWSAFGQLKIEGVWDSYIYSQNTHGLYHLIGSYAGWDKEAIYIAGYNATNGQSYSTKKVYIGKKIAFDLTTNNLLGVNSLKLNDPNKTTNWNNEWQSGFFEGDNLTSAPESGGWFWGINMGHSNNNSSNRYGGQVLIKNSSKNPTLYFRSRDANGDGDWVRVIHNQGNQSINGEMSCKGIKLGGYNPNPEYYSNNNYIAFGDPNVSEDFIGYKSHTFYLKDSPGGGDTRDPDLWVGGNITSEKRIKAEEILVEDIAATNMNLSGDIAANNITIKTNGQTADFVFEPDYQLKDLSEVETFIKTNKHLENIPSATEMEEQGVNLAEMNKLLLQKVEELTLYVIEKDKKIDKLEVARQKEHGELEKLEERLAKIEGLFPRE